MQFYLFLVVFLSCKYVLHCVYSGLSVNCFNKDYHHHQCSQAASQSAVCFCSSSSLTYPPTVLSLYHMLLHVVDDDDVDDEGRINFSVALSPKTARTRNNKPKQ